VNPGPAGHLHVEDDDVRAGAWNAIERFGAARRATDDLAPGSFEQRLQRRLNHRMIVGEEYTNHARSFMIGSWTDSCVSSWPELTEIVPPACSTRSRIDHGPSAGQASGDMPSLRIVSTINSPALLTHTSILLADECRAALATASRMIWRMSRWSRVETMTSETLASNLQSSCQ